MSAEGPPPAAGVRLPWAELPPRIPAALEEWLGARIATVRMQSGGFSPGVAARLEAENGRRVFVKAVHHDLNPDSPTLLRREARVVAALPPETPAPRHLWTYDEGEGGWIMLVLENIDGQLPTQPWTRDEFDRVFDALIGLSEIPVPASLPLRSASVQFVRLINGWKRLAEAPDDRLDPWSARHLHRLIKLEESAPAAAAGDALLHFDYRADNVLLTADKVYVVDWPAACIGAPWVDLVGFAPSAVMNGAPLSAEEMIVRHPLARATDPDAVTATIAALAGYFTHRALLPPPPGLPTLRAFQDAQGIITREWLRERTGWQ